MTPDLVMRVNVRTTTTATTTTTTTTTGSRCYSRIRRRQQISYHTTYQVQGMETSTSQTEEEGRRHAFVSEDSRDGNAGGAQPLQYRTPADRLPAALGSDPHCVGSSSTTKPETAIAAAAAAAAAAVTAAAVAVAQTAAASVCSI